MELDHEFTVPVPVDQAWAVLLDVERVASCMPGATLDSVEGEEFHGRMKVKVGAMTITYRGVARITSADEASRTVTMDASAKEARGSGTAAATVTAQLHDEGELTRVTVHTKLNVTGRPAQFGRNILSEVGSKLISRFADDLAAELQADPQAGGQASAAAGEAAAGTREDEEEDKPSVPQQRQASAAESAPQQGDKVVAPIRRRRDDDDDDAIDLLAVAGPSVIKRAVPAVGGALVLLLTFRFLRRRRRNRS